MRHHRSKGLLVATVFVALVLPPVITASPPARADQVGLDPIATLDFKMGATVLVDNVARRLIVMDKNAGTTEFKLFDAATGRELSRRTLPYEMPASSFSLTAAHAFDESGRRLWALAYKSVLDRTARANPLLLTLSVEGEVLQEKPLADLRPGFVLKGMSWSPEDGRLYVVMQPVLDPVIGTEGTYGVAVDALDPATGRSAWPAGAQIIDTCQRTVNTNLQAAVWRSPVTRRLYIGCGAGSALVAYQPGLPAVAEIDIDNPARPSVLLHPIAGAYAYGESLVDPVAGKFLMVSQGPLQEVQAAWIFDVAHRVFTGVVSAGDGNVVLSGVDPVTGTVFVGLDSHVLIGSDRLRKTPQAFAIPLNVTGSTFGILAVASAGTVVIPVNQADNTNTPVLFRLSAPVLTEEQEDDADAATIDAAEAPGQVGADYVGDAQAFGFRIAHVAGIEGVLQNVVALQSGWYVTAQQLTQGTIPFGDGTRDVYFGRVKRAHVSQSEGVASAIEGDRDALTDADWFEATGRPWPFALATCADLGTGATQDAEGPTAVACDQASSTVTAHARHQGSAASGPGGHISAEESSATTTLRRPSRSPVRVVSEAEARNVDIAGVVRIGRVASESVAEAGGRPGTAKASYERVFEDVSMPGYQCDLDCDEEEVAERMNQVLGLKFRVELPAARVMATPRGARGDASRDPWQHQQDVVLNDQADSELQVPALRLTYLNDNAHRSRVVFDFAATDAAADFRLFALGGGGDGIEEVFAGSSFGVEGTSAVDLLPSLDTGEGTTLDGQTIDSSRPAGDDEVGVGGFLRRLARGLRLALLGRSHTLLNVLLWLLLSIPAFLATRRRYLLRVMGVR